MVSALLCGWVEIFYATAFSCILVYNGIYPLGSNVTGSGNLDDVCYYGSAVQSDRPPVHPNDSQMAVVAKSSQVPVPVPVSGLRQHIPAGVALTASLASGHVHVHIA